MSDISGVDSALSVARGRLSTAGFAPDSAPVAPADVCVGPWSARPHTHKAKHSYPQRVSPDLFFRHRDIL
jgi:hypothetical protein